MNAQFPKQFTKKEAEWAKDRLRSLVTEFEGLIGKHPQDNAYRVAFSNLESEIQYIFGSDSLESQDDEFQSPYRYVLPYDSQFGRLAFDMQERESFNQSIRAVIDKLNNLIKRVDSRIIRQTEEERAVEDAKTLFGRLHMDPVIAATAGTLFRDGHYRQSVFDAYLALEGLVKDKSGVHDKSGADLMRQVFSKSKPILRVNGLVDQSDLDEQEGMMHLYEGAALAFRNPRAHCLNKDSVDEALDALMVLDFLARRARTALKSISNL